MSGGAREPAEVEAGRTPSAEPAAAEDPTRERRHLQGRSDATVTAELLETQGDDSGSNLL